MRARGFRAARIPPVDLRNPGQPPALTKLSLPVHFPSKTSVGGSISLLKASAVFAKPRWASAPL
jgi:hypothetical protein